MATVIWTDGSANWTTVADWSSGTVPGPSDNVFISNSGSYTVSITTTVNVNSVAVSDANAALTLENGAALSLTGGMTVGGSLDIDTDGGTSGSTLNVGGDLTNSGTVDIGTGFNRDGGSTVTIAGNLNNSGTLNIHDDTASATVVTAGNSVIPAPSTSSGTSLATALAQLS
jgi:hypothetical protein